MIVDRPYGSISLPGDLSRRAAKKLIEQDGLTGVTSNPSIFEKAIGESTIHSAMKAGETQATRCHGAL